MTRGNALYDQRQFGNPVFYECFNTGIDALARAYQKVLDRPSKPVPKLGRPPLAAVEKLRRKLDRELKLGQLQLI